MPLRLAESTTFRALRYRNYRLLWLGQTGHSATLWMDQVARAVLILHLTNSALMLSLVIATRLAPILLFGLIGGAVADRADRRRVLMSTQWVTFATHLFLGVAVTAGFIATWQVFVTAFVAGTAMAFNQPVRQSLIPLMVPKEDLLNAVALNATALSFMRIGGGAIAGLLLIPFDTGGVYLITAGVYLLVILTTALMDLPGERNRPRKETGILDDLREGFSYVGQNQVLLMVTGMALILFILGFPYQQVFVPLLATRTLDLGDSGVGWLAGATGLGAFIGSLVVASRPAVKRPGIQLIVNMLVFGGALVGISLQSNVVLTSVLLAVAGAMTVTYMAFTNSILLQHSTPEMHGRVMSLLSLDRGLIPFGAITAGVLVSTLGVRPGLFALGSAVIAVSALVLVLAGPRLRSITSEGTLAPRGHVRVPEAETAETTNPMPGAPQSGRSRS